jgi:hypothetical protein
VGSRSKTTVCPQDTTTGIEETSVPTIKSTQKQINDSSKDAFATSSNSLPAYSYKDYSPTPTTVYTQHEEEANDLVETLKGCVIIYNELPSKRYITHGQTAGLRHGMAGHISSRRR